MNKTRRLVTKVSKYLVVIGGTLWVNSLFFTGSHTDFWIGVFGIAGLVLFCANVDEVF